jgi:hypothetical protein
MQIEEVKVSFYGCFGVNRASGDMQVDWGCRICKNGFGRSVPVWGCRCVGSLNKQNIMSCDAHEDCILGCRIVRLAKVR